MRLLVAEDQKDLNDIITKTLTRNHYTVDSCFDGEEALDCFAMAEYDALILDIMMPKKSGLEVLKVLRASGSAVPVLLLTARDSVSDRVAGLDAGADDYLIKPFAFEAKPWAAPSGSPQKPAAGRKRPKGKPARHGTK